MEKGTHAPLWLPVLLLLSSLWTGCIKDPQFQTIKDLEILEIKDDRMQLLVEAIVYNPNSVGATIQSSESKIYINDLFIGNGRTQEKLRINGKDTTQVRILADMDLRSLSALINELSSTKAQATVRLVGSYQLKTGVKDLTLKAESEEKMDVWSQLELAINRELTETGFRLKRISPKSVSLSGAEISLELEVANEFPFSYDLQSVELQLAVGGHPFGSYTLDQTKTMHANSREIVQGEVRVSSLSAMTSMTNSFFGGSKEMIAKGTAQVFIQGHPFFIPIRQELSLGRVLN